MHIKNYILHIILSLLILALGFVLYTLVGGFLYRHLVVLFTCLTIFLSNIYYHKHSSKLTKEVVLEYLLVSTLIYLVYFYISLF